jgi:HAE1 family hydrophobic/amphiphilic exporter-1
MEKFFVSRPIFAIVLSIIIVLLGAISIFNLTIEEYPDITPPVVEVAATYSGADALTVDNAVATPLAENIMGVSDMLYIQSTSANSGTMNIQVTFEIGSDPDMDAIFTQNNVSSATALLPASVTQQGVTTQKTQRPRKFSRTELPASTYITTSAHVATMTLRRSTYSVTNTLRR